MCISQEEGLDDVKQMIRIDYDNTHQRLRGVLKVFEDNCQNYITKAEGPVLKGMQGVGKTDLDKYRLKMCKNKVVRSLYYMVYIQRNVRLWHYTGWSRKKTRNFLIL